MKNRIFVIFGVLVMLSNCLNYGCISSKKKQNEYINNDSTAIFSTHPSRPFKYGFALSKEECDETFGEYLRGYNLKKGEVVAEVGAASGWIMGALSVSLDSVTFYIEDIDTNYLNNYQFEKVVEHFTKLRTTPQTNKFRFVIGTYTTTNLPDNTFDKIILNNTFHEITETDAMIKDIGKKLKPGGKIIVYETYSNDYITKYHEGCNIKAYKLNEVCEKFKKGGFYLTQTSDPENSFLNFLYFERDSIHARKYNEKKKSVEEFIRELDKLNDKSISKDYSLTQNIAYTLAENLDTISTVFPSLQKYINLLGNDYLKSRKYSSAINVLSVNLILYPFTPEVYNELGDAYSETGYYEEAIEIFTKSLEIDSLNGEIYNSRGIAFFELENYNDAVLDYTKAIRLDSQAKDLYLNNRGLAYEEMYEFEKAYSDFSAAIAVKPKEAEYYLNRAELMMKPDEYEEAIFEYDKIIKLFPKNSAAYIGRAKAKYSTGDKTGSKNDLEKAKSLKKEAKKKK